LSTCRISPTGHTPLNGICLACSGRALAVYCIMMDSREGMIMPATGAGAGTRPESSKSNRYVYPSATSKGINGILKNDGDTVYVGQSCTNEASDHRSTRRRRIEIASSTDLEAKSPDTRCAPMLYFGLTKLQRRYENSGLGKPQKGKEKRPVCGRGRKKILRRPRTQQTVNDLLTLSINIQFWPRRLSAVGRAGHRV
jgi:hypothetical protein